MRLLKKFFIFDLTIIETTNWENNKNIKTNILTELTSHLDDVCASEDLYKGTTPFYWLASTPVGREILQAHLELLDRENLDAAPLVGPF